MIPHLRTIAFGVAFLSFFLSHAVIAKEPVQVRIGAKAFTESVVLAEVLAHLAAAADAKAETITLGGTPVVWNALLAGEIDCYVEYTGTLRQEILQDVQLTNDASIRTELARRGVVMSQPLGFNNTYALGISSQLAERAPGLHSISDLQQYPDVRYGFGNEFMDRGDGWPQLSAAYGLPTEQGHGLDHDLAYRGLESGSIDVMDVYTTDAEIKHYDLVVLEDDLGFFPTYDAVILMRDDLAKRAPDVVKHLLMLERAIDESTMIELNARVKLDRVPEAVVAADFVREAFGIEATPDVETRTKRLLRYTREHLLLVGVSMLGAITIAIPLGVLSAKWSRLGQFVLGFVGIVQTIPSLVLFVVLIPFLGVGPMPAICALFLYSLLPIVRNTHAGLVNIPETLRESALALGLPPTARLRLIELPLAARSILAGVKTAAVINIGTATLGGFINAGGYGEPIFAGIRLDRNDLLLEGAIPAALMALIAQGVFEMAERWSVP
ncbi:MAG: ABC transporter permease subunit, partial [Planctomycetaceae bacterium]|nr:ABC transporter permease subunit [Planctomycetaceae bacterium]